MVASMAIFGFTSSPTVNRQTATSIEGRSRKERGEDVAVAAIQWPLTPDLEALRRKLEVIPTTKARQAGKEYELPDAAAIHRRHPAVILASGVGCEMRRVLELPVGVLWRVGH
jgi:K+-sensing histidine kinase KdpD